MIMMMEVGECGDVDDIHFCDNNLGCTCAKVSGDGSSNLQRREPGINLHTTNIASRFVLESRSP